MSGADGLIVTLPLGGDEALHWWRLDDGIITQRGQNEDVRDAAGLPSATPGERIMAIAPTELTFVNWLAFPDLKPRQAEGAARVEAARRGIGGADANHAATRALEDEDGTVLTATIAPAALSGGLAHLQAIGIDPDFVTPVGLLVQPGDEDDWLEAEIGGERFLRSSRQVLPAEDALVAAVAGDIRPVVLNDEEADAALEIAFSDPPLNLRQGRFAKRRRAQGMGKRQWQLIAITLALAVLATLLIALVTLAKYSFGADQQDAAALAQARTIVPEANDLESAERALDALLIGRGGGASFGASAAALFQAVQSAPDVTIQRVAYGPDGTLSATLAAPQPDQLNQVLVPLQTSMGYVITQAPHQGAEGGTVIDITVRAP
ncbi:type II secretion system protein GspL [Novosphingopyxis iocasae]|uniref:type II secretion system protein GspL n=1 Tax=Novosphingopyxis iocasae TaxID=2762729 RepID=UPI0016512066|nr:type II secretion system protein GspL [Novosphingopyxis iocasae]